MSLKKAIFERRLSEHDERPQGPYLVIYPDNFSDLSWYATGYLSAAKLLIDALLKKGVIASDDAYVFPILYNLIHALELHLKIYLGILCQHYQRRSCKCLPSPNSAVDKIIKEHDLKKIYQAIHKMVNHEKLHGNREIQKIKPLIDEIEELGLNTESLRYFKIKGGNKNKLLEKQRWIYLDELKNIFSEAIEILKKSYLSMDFGFCALNEFKKSKLEEIEYMIQILIETRDKSGFVFSRPEERISFDPSELGEYLELSQQNKTAIEQFVSNFNSNKLVLANRGIRFGVAPPDSIPDKDWFEKNWDRPKLIEHLFEKFNSVNDAINQMRIFKKYIEDRIALREKCQSEIVDRT